MNEGDTRSKLHVQGDQAHKKRSISHIKMIVKNLDIYPLNGVF